MIDEILFLIIFMVLLFIMFIMMKLNGFETMVLYGLAWMLAKQATL